MVMTDFGDLREPSPKTKLNLWLRVLKHVIVEPQDVVKESICQQNAQSKELVQSMAYQCDQQSMWWIFPATSEFKSW